MDEITLSDRFLAQTHPKTRVAKAGLVACLTQVTALQEVALRDRAAAVQAATSYGAHYFRSVVEFYDGNGTDANGGVIPELATIRQDIEDDNSKFLACKGAIDEAAVDFLINLADKRTAQFDEIRRDIGEARKICEINRIALQNARLIDAQVISKVVDRVPDRRVPARDYDPYHSDNAGSHSKWESKPGPRYAPLTDKHGR